MTKEQLTRQTRALSIICSMANLCNYFNVPEDIEGLKIHISSAKKVIEKMESDLLLTKKD